MFRPPDKRGQLRATRIPVGCAVAAKKRHEMDHLGEADARDRTGDLALTRGALCQLSYVGGTSASYSEMARRCPCEPACEGALHRRETRWTPRQAG